MPEATVAISPELRSWNRDQQLRKLGFENYAEYLASHEWADVKRRYRASLRPQDCGLCGTGEDLQIHHLTYERVGEEKLTDLVALCKDCHSMLHTLERRGDIEGLDFAGLVDHARAERNRKRLEERFGKIEVSGANERRDKDRRRVLAFAKQVLMEAERRQIDTSDEVSQIDKLARALNERVLGRAA